MARHTYLNSQDCEEALKVLRPPQAVPNGHLDQKLHWSSDELSQWLENKLINFLDFKKVHPILLGSWARQELCPKSDLDVLLLGSEEEILEFSEELYKKGIPLRYRTPLNKEDWSEGVQPFDILNLLQARTLEKTELWVKEKLEKEQNKIRSSKKLKQQILKDISADRKTRRENHDSISNFLEPNLKQGPGGLRDLMQGLAIIDLLPEKFTDDQHAQKVLKYYKDFFLSVRQRLHLTGFSDQLVATEQASMAEWLGYKDSKSFMREIQKGLSRVLFYSDWVLEKALAKAEMNRKFKNHKDMALALKKNNSRLMQYKVRSQMDYVKAISSVQKGSVLNQILAATADEKWMDAFFQSRLIDKFIPHFINLVGYVQHDQYHRFTADAHLQQVCREVKRVYQNPRRLMSLAPLVKKLNKKDWQIISWTALYHDLAKGQGGSHEELGESFVKEDLKKFKIDYKEVQWMVRNHLEISKAAFRKDPYSPQTWRDLQSLDLKKGRLQRLAVFTAIDILGTNPEALNSWKAQLIHDLTRTLESQSAQNLLILQKNLAKKFAATTLEKIHPLLFERLPLKTLLNDLKNLKNPIEVYQAKNKEIWIRFYQADDERGLLYKYVQQLYNSGCAVRHALVHTLPEIGVYDWFHISSAKSVADLKKRLAISRMPLSSAKKDKIHFSKIEVVSESDNEWVISFRGLDQKGMLLAACEKLYELGAEIKSARVHTWGREIDDLFTIQAVQDRQHFLNTLRKDLI